MNDIANELRSSELKKARGHFKKLGLNPDSNEDVVASLKPDSDKKTIVAALSLLQPMPIEILDQIKTLAVHADPRIRTTCFNRVAVFLKEKGTDFYVDCLNHPTFREKSDAVYRIWRHGDASAIPAITKRLNQIIKTRKGRPYCFHNGESELTHCLDFLHPHRDQKSIRALFDALVKKWSMLDQKETWWITDQLEYFAQNAPLEEDRRLPSIVRLLDSDHPIFLAVNSGDIQSARQMFEQGVSVYSWDTNRSLARIAIRNGNLEMLQLLIEYGLNIERPIHGFGMFPLLFSMRENQSEIANFILELEIDVNRRDEYGISLFMAACCGLASQTQLNKLIQLGANINDRRFRGETPFIHAARSEAIEAMGVLLTYGVDINEVDDRGKSALIHCAQGGKRKSVEWLIEHGADLNHCEERDRDALYWAKQNKREEIVQLLQFHLDKA